MILSRISYFLKNFSLLGVAQTPLLGSATTSHIGNRVVTYEQVTEWMMVYRGFPQASGVSPLLFNISIRRLLRHFISSALQFADDTTLAAADPSLKVVAQNLTASFNIVKEFCDSHELVINSSKTQLIVFRPLGKRIPDDFNLRLDNCCVQPQKAVQLLV